ncbi:DUF3789 domain-containing protein [Cytobacillus praedii]|nr:DUF3789 domain-containing protein [Cytobacillus praedii]
MNGFIIGSLLGLVVGGCIGVMTMALMFAASKSDDQMLGEDQYI